MMIFFGVVLLTLSLFALVKGNIGNETALALLKYEKNEDREEVSDNESLKLAIKAIFHLVYQFVILIIHLGFLVAAVSVDTLLIPTLLMIVLFVIQFPYNYYKSKDTNNEQLIEKYSKNRTLGRTLKNLIHCAYYSYILFLLIL